MSIGCVKYILDETMNSVQDDFYNMLIESSRLDYFMSKYRELDPITTLTTNSIGFYCNSINKKIEKVYATTMQSANIGKNNLNSYLDKVKMVKDGHYCKYDTYNYNFEMSMPFGKIDDFNTEFLREMDEFDYDDMITVLQNAPEITDKKMKALMSDLVIGSTNDKTKSKISDIEETLVEIHRRIYNGEDTISIVITDKYFESIRRMDKEIKNFTKVLEDSRNLLINNIFRFKKLLERAEKIQMYRHQDADVIKKYIKYKTTQFVKLMNIATVAYTEHCKLLLEYYNMQIDIAKEYLKGGAVDESI